MDYGMKISKPSYDVKTAGVGDLLFHSSYPFLKIKSRGSSSVNYTNDGGSTDVLIATHSLGYIPLFTFYTQWYNVETSSKETTYIHAPFYDGTYADLGIFFSIRPYANTTQLRLIVESWDGTGGNYDLSSFYAIYYDPEVI